MRQHQCTGQQYSGPEQNRQFATLKSGFRSIISVRIMISKSHQLVSHKLIAQSGLPTLLSNITAGASTALFCMFICLFDTEEPKKVLGQEITQGPQGANDS